MPVDEQSTQPFRLTGNLDINTLLSFAFGIVFVAVILGFSTQYPNPTPLQIKSFITVLALSAAGIGAVIPGFIEVRYKSALRASGALALFVVVFFGQPVLERAVVKLDPPSSPPDPVATTFLADFDTGNIDGVWSEIDPAAKGIVVPDKKTAENLYESYRKPLGKVVSREQTGVGGQESPPGYPVGIYRSINYRTRFEKSAGCRAEQVILRATQSIDWRVYSYLISPTQIEC